MKISKSNLLIIELLKNFLSLTNEEQHFFYASPNDFTRKRHLDFQQIAMIVINLCKRSLSIDLEKYFETISSRSTTLSAFCQQRLKLKWQFFCAWHFYLVQCFYLVYNEKIYRWQGLRLVAVDGSTAYLMNKSKVIDYFGVQTNQAIEVRMARIVNFFDVLNKISIWSTIQPIECSEQKTVHNLLENMEDDMLGIYDRGYAGFAFFYLNISGFEQEKKFIARCSRQFRVVDQFIASGKKSQIVSINPTQYAIKQLFEMGYKIDANETVKLRLVRIKLKTGEIEVIATNLMDEKLYPSDIFKWLYAKRWGIETEYDALKNIYQIEQFSGYSPEVIQQDFYATIFIANLHQIFIKDSEKDINAIGEKRQYKYQHNRNVGFGLLKEEIVKLFI